MTTTQDSMSRTAGAEAGDVPSRSLSPSRQLAARRRLGDVRGALVAALRWVAAVFSRNWFFELSVFLLLIVAYNFVRAMPEITKSLAFEHARHILAAEGAVFDYVEMPLNQWIVGVPAVAVAACYMYAVLHYFATPAIFFMSRHKGGWQYWRGYWAFVLASGFALIGYALYPVAPPRLVPGLDIVDVMRTFAGYGWWGAAASAPRGIGDATNQFAAMPSMHVGWALWCAVQMWGFGSLAWRLLAITYPTVLTFTVLATGNHFLLDLVAGAACVAVAYGIVQVVGRLVRHRQSSGPTEQAGA